MIGIKMRNNMVYEALSIDTDSVISSCWPFSNSFIHIQTSVFQKLKQNTLVTEILEKANVHNNGITIDAIFK